VGSKYKLVAIKFKNVPFGDISGSRGDNFEDECLLVLRCGHRRYGGGSMHLRNVGQFLLGHKAQRPKIKK
jgi:hypothetical protein